MLYDIQDEKGNVHATDLRITDLPSEIEGIREQHPRVLLTVYIKDEIEKRDGVDRIHGEVQADDLIRELTYLNEHGILNNHAIESHDHL